MPIMHLGVVDIPYVDNEPKTARRARVKAGKSAPKPKSVNVGVDLTGDVAEILEGKYHIMEHFYEMHGKEIGDLVAGSLAGHLETMLMGGPQEASFASAEAGIDQMFRDFLSNKELDQLGYPGIPTKAAIDGVNPRFKGGKGPKNRPSFVATGLYQSSFKTWVD